MTDTTPRKEQPPPRSSPPSSMPSKAEYAALDRDRNALADAENATRGRNNSGMQRAGADAWMRYTSLGIQMALFMVGGSYGGIWLDGEMESSPLWTLVGTALGFAGAITSAVMTMKRAEREEAARQPPQQPQPQKQQHPRER